MHERDYMNDIINKDIQVASIEAKMASTGNMKFIIIDTQKNKYYFYQKNKGVDCDVYMSFTGMGLKQGDTCNIGFTEEAKSFTNQKGETINYSDRFILGLREANGAVPTPVPSQPQMPRSGANTASQGYNKPQSAIGNTGKIDDDKYWDKKAYKQCLWGYWVDTRTHWDANADTTAFPLSEAEKDLVWKVFKQIEVDADKRFNPSVLRQTVQKFAPQVVEPELPVIQQDEPPLSAYEQETEFVAPDIAEEARRLKEEEDLVAGIPF